MLALSFTPRINPGRRKRFELPKTKCNMRAVMLSRNLAKLHMVHSYMTIQSLLSTY